MPERLRGARRRTVGTKQTLKAIQQGRAGVVYVARDAEEKVTDPVLAACRERGVEVVIVESMRILGQYAGIDVGAAAAAVLADDGVVERREMRAYYSSAGARAAQKGS